MIFPREIWTKIFHELDKFTVREIASLVCKEWLTIVRNDFKLSSEIIVNSREKICIKASEINSLLLSYPMLKTLHLFLHENEDILEELNFEPCIYLTKVIVNGNFNDQMGFRETASVEPNHSFLTTCTHSQPHSFCPHHCTHIKQFFLGNCRNQFAVGLFCLYF